MAKRKRCAKQMDKFIKDSYILIILKFSEKETRQKADNLCQRSPPLSTGKFLFFSLKIRHPSQQISLLKRHNPDFSAVGNHVFFIF
jgi:hypothetical protein